MRLPEWSELSRPQRAAVVVVGTVQLALAGAAWRDLARRPAGEVNGSKTRWAAIISIGWFGPLAWYRRGRRPA